MSGNAKRIKLGSTIAPAPASGLAAVASEVVIVRIERLLVRVGRLLLRDGDYGALSRLKAGVYNGESVFDANADDADDAARAAIASPGPNKINKLGEKRTRDLETFWLRVVLMCDKVHCALSNGTRLNQRGLWYELKTIESEEEGVRRKCFPSYPSVLGSVQHLSVLLATRKCDLGIVASSKGLVAGNLLITEPGDGYGRASFNCLDNVYAIDRNPTEIARLGLTLSARCILVVEKETVFSRLVESKIFLSLPCVIITGKGYPDLATKCFLRHLHDACPSLPVLGLVDCNPDGLAILSTYKFGPNKGCASYESQTYDCMHLGWLGVLPSEGLATTGMANAHGGMEAGGGMMGNAPRASLSKRDEGRLRGLIAKFEKAGCGEAWIREMRIMQERKSKCDIEGFLSTFLFSKARGGVGGWVARKVRQGGYVVDGGV